jgi:transposase
MLSRGLRVFIAIAPLDMRGSFDAMAGRVRALGLEPVDGGYYVFFSKRRTLVAILHFDGSGWCAFKKRLVRGTFQVPETPEGVDRVVVDGRLLASILEGIDLRAPRRRWYSRSGLGAS